MRVRTAVFAYEHNKKGKIVKNFLMRLSWFLVKLVFGTIRFSLFVILLLLGRVLQPIASLASGLGLMLFLFCALFCRDQVVPMWAGAGLAFGSVVFIIVYHEILMALAPDGMVLYTEI